MWWNRENGHSLFNNFPTKYLENWYSNQIDRKRGSRLSNALYIYSIVHYIERNR